MGVVHRGWLYYNPKGSRAGSAPHPVAIKALHPMLRGRERPRALFLSEALALERLSHPNIVHFFGLVDDGVQLAIVMELVDGQALSEIIARKVAAGRSPSMPCLPFSRAWHYFSQLLGSLASVHALGIIHRDIKPANVLVRRDGVVKLTDFGIARVPADEARKTGGMAPGTGAYMAPEQVTAGEIDARTDLYSAAIVLYEMLTGVTPFDRPERNEIMVRTAQLDEIAAPISSQVSSAPQVLDALMARALAKDKAERFATAIELGDAFRELLGLDAAGWAAQQNLAKHAKRLSLEMNAAPACGPQDADSPTRSAPNPFKSPIHDATRSALAQSALAQSALAQSAPAQSAPAQGAAAQPGGGTQPLPSQPPIASPPALGVGEGQPPEHGNQLRTAVLMAYQGETPEA